MPAVDNGTIRFTVTLEVNDDPKLRSGLKADVFVINSVKDDVIRLANRSFYHGPGNYEMWVVSDGKAYKRNVVLGESSYEFVEVLEGLKPGETVIVSDMSRFRDDTKIKIRE